MAKQPSRVSLGLAAASILRGDNLVASFSRFSQLNKQVIEENKEIKLKYHDICGIS